MNSQTQPEKKNTQIATDNAVLIGKKPIMTYVTAVLTQFTRGNKKIILKARGKAITSAVTVAELLKNKILPGQIKISNISIGTESVGKGNEIRDVSTIEIVLEPTK
ncbi:MAG: DNA-binding protein Alba [Thermoprotei archaeon]|jgi:DNA-binding protein